MIDSASVEWAAELPLLKTNAKLGSNVQAKFKRLDGSEKVATKNEFAFFFKVFVVITPSHCIKALQELSVKV